MSRTFVECDDEPKYMGAIFMCNQATKQECFTRKVFGLPSALASFVKNVKAGMFLFLFEHVERKLYGIFEATCDGAMNIVPSTFPESISTFPAQVRFKILWKCRPLIEDEYRSAIRENYFAPYKFHFGLSYEQVGKLIELFSLKKVNPLSQSIYSLDNRTSSKYSTRSFKEDNIKHSERNQITCGDPSSAFKHYPELPNQSSFQSDPDVKETFHGSPGRLPVHHIAPSFEGEKPNMGQKLIYTQSGNFRSHSCQPNPSGYHHSPNEKLTAADEIHPTRRFAETQVPHYETQPYSHESYVAADDYGHIVSRCHDELPFPETGRIDSNEYNNCGSTCTYRASKVRDSFPSMPVPVHGHGYTVSPRRVNIAGGPRELDNAAPLQEARYSAEPGYWKPLLDDNLVTDVESSPQFSSGYSSNSYAASVNCSEGAHYSPDNIRQYPISSSSRFLRTSAFTRLSNKSGKVFSQYPDSNSLDLLKLLSQKRKQYDNNMQKPWKKTFTGYEETVDKKLNTFDQMEPIRADSLAKFITHSEQFAEESEQPFYDFKRRCQAKTAEAKAVEGDQWKTKRRKLVRPSFEQNDTFGGTNSGCLCSAKHSNSDNRSEGSINLGRKAVGTVHVCDSDRKNVATADSKAETSAESFHIMVENKNASGVIPKKRCLDFDLNSDYIPTEPADTNYDGGDGDEAAENSAVGIGEYAYFHVDHNSRVFSEGKFSLFSVKSDDENSSAAVNDESGTTHEGLSLNLMLKCNQDEVDENNKKHTSVAMLDNSTLQTQPNSVHNQVHEVTREEFGISEAVAEIWMTQAQVKRIGNQVDTVVREESAISGVMLENSTLQAQLNEATREEYGISGAALEISTSQAPKCSSNQAYTEEHSTSRAMVDNSR